MANTCRHFGGIFADMRGGQICGKGHDVRKLAGVKQGIINHIPCIKRPNRGAFDCPDLDRFTDSEMAERDEATKQSFALVTQALPTLQRVAAEMIAEKCSHKVMDCVWCDAKDALHIGVAVEVNNHARAQCESCGRGFIE